MRASTWLLAASLLAVACGDDKGPGTVGEPSAPLTPPSSGGAGGAPSGPSTFYSVGDPLDASLSWKGYTEGSAELGTITLGDYHDPTGEKGIRAILLTEGQADCAPCVAEAKDLSEKMAGKWQSLGIQVIQLLVTDGSGKPASASTALAWRDKIKAPWPVGIDPEFTFAQIGSNPYPIQVLIDPRTLTLVDRITGYRAELPEVEALAEKNQ